jgi:hypothetical protein
MIETTRVDRHRYAYRMSAIGRSASSIFYLVAAYFLLPLLKRRIR